MEIQKKTILLVEDEALIAMMEARQLEKEGYAVVTAANGPAAIAAVHELHGGIDLILMDIDLGHGMDGTEAAAEILKDHDIPVVFLSSHTEKEVVEKTEKITSYGYVVKNSGSVVLDASIKMAFKLYGANRELRRKERMLTESEEKYRLLHEQAGIAVGFYSPEGIVISYNERALANMNARAEDVTGKSMYDLFPREEADVYMGRIRDASAAEHDLIYEDFLKLPVGEVWFESTFTRICDENGSLKGIQIQSRDISERKRAEEALRASEEKFRATLDATPFPIAIVDVEDNKIQHWSRSAQELFGHTAPTAQEWYEIAYPDPEYRQDVVSRWKPFLETAKASGKTVNTGEYQVTCSDGSVRICELYASILKENLILTFNDITQKRKLERDYQVLFREMLDGFAVHEMIFDRDGAPVDYRFLAVNPAFERITGLKARDIEGKSVHEALPGIEQHWINAYGRVVRTGEPASFENYSRDLDRHFRVTAFRPAPGQFACIFSDITDLVRSTEELARSREALELALEFGGADIWEWDLAAGTLTYTERYARLLGYAPGEVPMTAQAVAAIVHPDDVAKNYAALDAYMEGNAPLYETECRIRKKNGDYVWVSSRGRAAARDREGKPVRLLGMNYDITGRKRVERKNTAEAGILEILNKKGSLHDLMGAVSLFLQEWSGCEAVGIRLREGDDFPYYEARGFPVEFLRLENALCVYDLEGQILRDGMGHPVIECMCGNVICGRFDPSKPFFTAHGSFWSNCTTGLLAATTDADRQARTRNRCNGMGYESVALIPLRSGGIRFGLIQLNDKREGMFIPSDIAELERMADHIAMALWQRMLDRDLRESEERHRQVIENSGAGYFFIDTEGRFRQVNAAWLRMHKYDTADEVIGKHFSTTQIDEGQQDARETVRKLLEGQQIISSKFSRRCRDGTVGYHTFSASPVVKGGKIIGIEGFLIDNTEHIRAEELLKQSVQEKDVLMRELQHRVKNNLNIIASLLTLEMDTVHDDHAKNVLQNAVTRMHSMSTIYEQLYHSESLKKINLKDYVGSIAHQLFNTINISPEKVTLILDLGEIELDLKRAVPVGLILNELITNALKYAWPGERTGALTISLVRANGAISLKVADDGVGLPADRREGMGTNLVRMLARQLEGEFGIESAGGTTARVSFPA